MLLSAAKSKLAAKKIAKSMALEDLERAIKNLQGAAEKLKKGEAEKAARQRAWPRSFRQPGYSAFVRRAEPAAWLPRRGPAWAGRARPPIAI